jgi:hypothetical protein
MEQGALARMWLALGALVRAFSRRYAVPMKYVISLGHSRAFLVFTDDTVQFQSAILYHVTTNDEDKAIIILNHCCLTV